MIIPATAVRRNLPSNHKVSKFVSFLFEDLSCHQRQALDKWTDDTILPSLLKTFVTLPSLQSLGTFAIAQTS